MFVDFADLLAHTSDDGYGNSKITFGTNIFLLDTVQKVDPLANDFMGEAPAPLEAAKCRQAE